MGGSQTAKFVKVFSLESFRYIVIYKIVHTHDHDQDLITPIMEPWLDFTEARNRH